MLSRREFVGALLVAPAVTLLSKAAPRPTRNVEHHIWGPWEFIYNRDFGTFTAAYRHTNGKAYAVRAVVTEDVGRRLCAGARVLASHMAGRAPSFVWAECCVHAIGSINYLFSWMVDQLHKQLHEPNGELIRQIWRQNAFGWYVSCCVNCMEALSLDCVTPFRIV